MPSACSKQIREVAVGTSTLHFHSQIDATDRQIDQLVYELYGLNDDEIKIVEQATP